MLTQRTSAHVSSSKNIKSFHSCRHTTGVSMAHLDRTRIRREDERLRARKARQLCLARQWSEHYGHVAGPMRVLPPSARTGQTKGR